MVDMERDEWFPEYSAHYGSEVTLEERVAILERVVKRHEAELRKMTHLESPEIAEWRRAYK